MHVLSSATTSVDGGDTMATSSNWMNAPDDTSNNCPHSVAVVMWCATGLVPVASWSAAGLCSVQPAAGLLFYDIIWIPKRSINRFVLCLIVNAIIIIREKKPTGPKGSIGFIAEGNSAGWLFLFLMSDTGKSEQPSAEQEHCGRFGDRRSVSADRHIVHKYIVSCRII